jgi:23S rRNA (cytidine1920-2'-O)/16S rRNA (cytidine1409-2'-O)-methyltransferase
LDTELVRRGLAPSREAARAAIVAGQVLVAGAPADKASRLVGPGENLVVAGEPSKFVSRGGDKLDAALDHFGIDVRGRRALDAGASTGGFTDCLLQRGAMEVVAVDVGHGQLHPKLRDSPDVAVREHINIRDASSAELGTFDIVCADLSFISLRTVAKALVDLATPGADLVLLVKPQFEAGRVEASRGRGVIRDPSLWQYAIESVRTTYAGLDAVMMGLMTSPITGARGNVEFLAHFRAGPVANRPAVDIEAVVRAAATVEAP